MPLLTLEPEVVQSTLSKARNRSLAGLIVALLTDNEPLLSASQDGASVTVREVGGGSVMRFTVESGQ